MTPAFGTIVMGVAALFFYLLLTFLIENALADSVASLGLAVAFYYGITAYACVWYFRRTLFESARNLFFRGIFPLLGALAMTWAFIKSAIDMIEPDYGYTAFGSIGGVFVLGVGMLVLGIPLMLAVLRVRHQAILPRRNPHAPNRSQGTRHLLDRRTCSHCGILQG